PMGKPLVGERGAKSNQDLVDQRVGVFAGGFAQVVATAHARFGRRLGGLKPADAVVTNSPQGLQRKRFPLPSWLPPVLDRRLAEAPNEIGKRLPHRLVGRRVRRGARRCAGTLTAMAQ